MWDDIIYTAYIVAVWEWINNLISLFMIDVTVLGFNLNRDSKGINKKLYHENYIVSIRKEYL